MYTFEHFPGNKFLDLAKPWTLLLIKIYIQVWILPKRTLSNMLSLKEFDLLYLLLFFST